jgi:hypothetical protein
MTGVPFHPGLSTPSLDFVHVLFLCSPDVAEELRLSVVMGLRKGFSLIRGMRRSLTDEEQHKIAAARRAS